MMAPARERSPNFPSISLPEALDLVQKLYEREKMAPASDEVVVKHWGYNGLNGASSKKLGGVRSFGLIKYVNKGNTRLVAISEMGKRLILDPRADSVDRLELIQKVALIPSKFKEVWEEFDGELPSSENMKHRLMFEKGFTDLAADRFIRSFLETVNFAKLSKDSINSTVETFSKSELENKVDAPAHAPTYRDTLELDKAGVHADSNTPTEDVRQEPTHDQIAIEFPLPNDNFIKVEMRKKVTRRDFEQILEILKSMGFSLIKD